MSRDRSPAAAAERRRAERAINEIRPARTTTPSRIHSQSRLVPEEAPGVAETLDGADGADVVALCVGGWVVGVAVALGLAEAVAVPAARQAADRAGGGSPASRRQAADERRWPPVGKVFSQNAA